MPQRIKPTPPRFCAFCSGKMERNQWGWRLEDMGVFLRRLYCNRACMANGMRTPEETQSRNYLTKKARRYLKSACVSCGTTRRLAIHHKDRDWRNNDPTNLETLCSACHISLHHAAGDISPKREKPPCAYCAKPSYRAGTCNTCRTRIRRHGDPFFGRKEWIASLKPRSLSA